MPIGGLVGKGCGWVGRVVIWSCETEDGGILDLEANVIDGIQGCYLLSLRVIIGIRALI